MAGKCDVTFPDQTVTRSLRLKKEIHRHLLANGASVDSAVNIPPDPDQASLATVTKDCKKIRHQIVNQEVKTSKGWVNSPKGALQLCIERGLVDLVLVRKQKTCHTMDGNKDKDGNTIPGFKSENAA